MATRRKITTTFEFENPVYDPVTGRHVESDEPLPPFDTYFSVHCYPPPNLQDNTWKASTTCFSDNLERHPFFLQHRHNLRVIYFNGTNHFSKCPKI